MSPVPSNLGKLFLNFHRPISAVSHQIAHASTFANNRLKQVSASQTEEARKTAIEITQKFDAHPANNHPFFTFLPEEVKAGLTPAQYHICAINFAYRTIGTVKTVAQVIVRAIENYDLETASKTGKNLFEETGSGKLEDMHLGLLAYTLNTHGDRVFGLPNFDILKIDPSLLLPATINFRKSQNKALNPSANYEELLGRLTAHEGAADKMLINFRLLFEAFKGYYSEDEFKKVIKYFDEHRDDEKEGGDVEAQHREAAIDVITKIIAVNPRAASRILRGGMEFLETQDRLWTELLSGMEKNRKSGFPVPPKIDFLKEKPVIQIEPAIQETPAYKEAVAASKTTPLIRGLRKETPLRKEVKNDLPPKPFVHPVASSARSISTGLSTSEDETKTKTR